MCILIVRLLAVAALLGPVIAPTGGAWALDQPKQAQEEQAIDALMEKRRREMIEATRRHEQMMQDVAATQRKMEEYNEVKARTDRCCAKLPLSERDRKTLEERAAWVRLRRLQMEAAQDRSRGAPQEDQQQRGSQN